MWRPQLTADVTVTGESARRGATTRDAPPRHARQIASHTVNVTTHKSHTGLAPLPTIPHTEIELYEAPDFISIRKTLDGPQGEDLDTDNFLISFGQHQPLLRRIKLDPS